MSTPRAAARSTVGPATHEPVPDDLRRLLVARPGLVTGPLLRFGLGPADRALVQPGQTVFPGEPLLERMPDAAIVEVEAAALAHAGGHGHVLHALPGGRVRAAVGQHPLTLACPVRGTVVELDAGRLVLRADATGLPGTLAAGEASRGELVIAVGGPEGELPPSAIDVGSAGAILVAGARMDLEALGRARAMGVRGVVVGGLVSRDLRGFRAAEVRQRAALHGGPPFAVLVLEGYGKRAIAPSTWARLLAAAGREVAIGIDPPLLLLPIDVALPAPGADRVRVCAGEAGGREGTFLRQLGRRRWPGGLEAASALVRLDPAEPGVPGSDHVVPLADLELLQ